MIRFATVGHLGLVLGFWLPSAAIGFWLGSRTMPTPYRALRSAAVILSVAFAWALLWVRLNMALVGAYTRGLEHSDLPAMFEVGLLAMAAYVVLPGGVLASYIAMYFRSRANR